jgi:hypothetical protein
MYAGLHRGSTGGETWFGGNENGFVEREPGNQKYATYPTSNQDIVEGEINPDTGLVKIMVPLTEFKFSIDEPIHSLQVFSATGAIYRSLLTPLTVFDATPARTWPAAWPPPGVQGGGTTRPRPAPGPLPATGVGSGVGFALVSFAGAAALATTMRRRNA